MAIRELELFLNHSLTDDIRSQLITKVTEMLTMPELVHFRCSLQSDYGIAAPIGLYDILRRIPLFADHAFMTIGEVFSGLFAVADSFHEVIAEIQPSLEQYEGHILWLLTDTYSSLMHQSRSFKDLGIPVKRIKTILKTAYKFTPALPKTIHNLDADTMSQVPSHDELNKLREYVDQLPNAQARALVFGKLLREIGRRPEEIILNGNQLNLELTDLPSFAFWVLLDAAQAYATPS
ncbi:Hypothetical protein GLP15_2707 [Giardia lamblia P15]|uniref:Uncharacterized protein n=1 Tax=Giardia intestinalis (strain P15) TaxID=658858 RepID=E1F8W1_GIAIA|nr:Hypothetical protein GLP15_2707 [Giardia lamblia P15]